MAKKKRRDCIDCIGYCNMRFGEGDCCGLGFEVEESLEERGGMLAVAVHPYEDACEKIVQPRSKEEFVMTAASLGIDWDINEVMSVEEYNSSMI